VLDFNHLSEVWPEAVMLSLEFLFFACALEPFRIWRAIRYLKTPRFMSRSSLPPWRPPAKFRFFRSIMSAELIAMRSAKSRKLTCRQSL